MSTQATFCATLADEFARAGLRHAVAAPGSRSTLLVLALEAEARIELHLRLDERSAGFAAVGIGLSTGLPAILVTTSGTAAAEVHAAVVEAHQAGVPLIVCTADRPPELQSVGAPQTIDQVGLYREAVRFSLHVDVPEEGGRASWRSLASRLVAEAVSSPAGPGPVHLNLGLREPFEPSPGPLPPARAGGRPFHEVIARSPAGGAAGGPLAELLATARRPLLLAGGGAGEPAALLAAAQAAGWPVLADPRSGLRRTADRGPGVVAAFDSLLRVGPLKERLLPDLVVRLGSPPASKVTAGYLGELAEAGVTSLLSDPFGRWQDPGRSAAAVVRASGEEVASHLGAAPVEPGWAKSWSEAEQAAQSAIEEALFDLGEAGELTEPLVARRLARSGAGTLVAASSMPVRDLEWYSEPSPSYPVVFSNRGANGIDGVISTTLGAALGGSPGPVVGLVGDLAFLHDATALYRSGLERWRSGSPCGLVVLDNKGGGIFSHLPQAASLPEESFERLFATPQEVDLAGLATACGCSVHEVGRADELDQALGAFLGELSSSPPGAIASVLICRIERGRGPAVREQLNAAVAAALS